MNNPEIGHARGPSVARRTATSLGALCILIAATPPLLHAQMDCEDVSGAWAVEMVLPGGGPTEVTVTLEQTTCEVTGFVEGRKKTAIKNGVAEGPTATFVVSAINQGSGGTLEITWTATVEGAAIHGTLAHPLMGVVDFKGKRVED